MNNALQHFESALQIDKNNIDALLNKGSVLHTLGKYSEAMRIYDAVLKLDKQCAMAIAYKGLSLAELGDIEKASHYFKKALSIDKDYDLASLSNDLATNILKSQKNNSVAN